MTSGMLLSDAGTFINFNIKCKLEESEACAAVLAYSQSECKCASRTQRDAKT